MPIERVSFGASLERRRRAVRLRWIAFVVVLAAAIGTYLWYQGALKPVDPGSERRELFTVESGESTTAILKRLADRDVIQSALAAKIYLFLGDRTRTLQAGTFVLRPSMTLEEVLAALAFGRAEEVVLTIPEGSTVAEIDHLLATRGLAATGALLACAKTCDLSAFTFLPPASAVVAPATRLEGFLYPDTYYVEMAGFNVAAFTNRLLSTFNQKVIVGQADALAKSGRNLTQIVTMASLLETEARGEDEQKTIAGILWKRLDGKMQLGVDAAVRYAVAKPTGALTQKDLESSSPYNLRRVRGLPPGPIANPGLAAITAALHPVDSQYLYYLHDGTGQVHYGRTLDEHNANKARYL
jgi:UPF0755 protein